VGDRTSVVTPEELAAWITWAERFVPEERSAFAPSTLTLTLRSGLDATQDGRLTLQDLAQHYTGVDKDGSGSLSPEEIAAAGQRQQRGTSAVRDAEDAPAPDAARGPLVPWQRSLEDALALARASGKPLLVCVNMDGEPASDLLALGRYRDPAFVELLRGFVPLLASPDRHRPRDRDGANARLADPRFGRLIDSEHIDIEPQLFERYFNGQRVAPRHVGVAVAPDGKATVLFDLFLLQDLRAVDQALRQHGKPDAPWVDVATLDDAGLLASPDAAARERLEARYAAGDAAARAFLLRGALSATRPVQQPELVWRALRDPERDLRRLALERIGAVPLGVPLELFPEALRVAAEFPGVGAELARGLQVRVERGPAGELVRARRLARIAEAEAAPHALDVAFWRELLAGTSATASAPADEGVFARLAAVEAALARAPADAARTTAYARLALAAAERMIASGGGNPSFLLQDARDAAKRALALDQGAAQAWAVRAAAEYQLSELDAAGDSAARALPGLVAWAETRLAADTLWTLAQCRTRALYAALGEEPAWPAAWLNELLDAHEVLLAHPSGTEEQAVAGLDALGNLELFARQATFVKRALARWPLSATLHNYYRWQLLRDGGAAALLAGYDGLELGPGQDAARRWFAGVAAIVAAERLADDGASAPALVAYQRAVGELREALELEPGYETTSLYYVALAQAGEARLLFERAQLDQALEAMRASVAACASALPADGLGHTRATTARSLGRALERAGRSEEARELAPIAAESAAAAAAGESR